MQKSYINNSIISNLAQKLSLKSNQQLLSIYQQSKLNQYVEQCIAIITLLKTKNQPLPPSSEQLLKLYDNMMAKLEIMQSSTEGWRIQKFGKNKQCILSTNVISAGRVLVRFDGQLELDVFNLASMVYEVDLFPEWVPFCKDSTTIKTIPQASKIVKISFDLPFISRRECFIFGQGIDRIDETNGVVIYTQGVTNNQEQQKRYQVPLKVDKGAVALDLKYFVCEIRVVKKGIYRFQAFADVDLGMSYLPGFILGFFTKKIGHWIFDKMIGIANNIQGTAFETRIKQDKEGFYKWLRQTFLKFTSKNEANL